MPVILASESATRKKILTQAGIAFTAVPANLAEDAMMLDWQKRGMTPDFVAASLAKAKAEKIAVDHATPNTYIIGCDQMMICGERWFGRAKTAAEAREHLQFLSGKTHYLITAVAVISDRKLAFQHTEKNAMQMRALSDEFIGRYLSVLADGALKSVGCYQIEALGAQLFDRIDGDFFAIQGLPLLPLLGFLRTVDVIGH